MTHVVVQRLEADESRSAKQNAGEAGYRLLELEGQLDDLKDRIEKWKRLVLR